MPQNELPLKDIHLPAEVGFWPLAPGWWLLALCFLILSAVCIWKYVAWRAKRAQEMRLVQQVQIALQAYQAEFNAGNNHQLFAQQLNALLRRAALSVGDAAAASLTDQQWLDFIERHWQGTTRLPHEQLQSLLLVQPYTPKAQLSSEQVSTSVGQLENWLVGYLKNANSNANIREGHSC